MSIVVRILLFEPAADCSHFSLSLSIAYTGLEPSNHAQKMSAALPSNGRSSGCSVRDRSPQLDRFVLNRNLKTVRHHADHRVCLSIKSDRLIQYGQIRIKARSKHALAQDHH